MNTMAIPTANEFNSWPLAMKCRWIREMTGRELTGCIDLRRYDLYVVYNYYKTNQRIYDCEAMNRQQADQYIMTACY